MSGSQRKEKGKGVGMNRVMKEIDELKERLDKLENNSKNEYSEEELKIIKENEKWNKIAELG